MPPGFNPLADLPRLVKEEGLQAEVLLCPGDLCDQADWDALGYAWTNLCEFAEMLGAEHVIATVGNHDIDSHSLHPDRDIDFGPRQLSPDFPCSPRGETNDYWESRISHARGEDWQAIALNSSLMRRLEEEERDHGEVHEETLEAIRAVATEASVPVNVLLCHHHPQPFTRHTPGDASHMASGDRLVKLLNDLPGGWMIVHGHKHYPHLDYLDGTGAAPARLVAGSTGINLWPLLSSYFSNQLHVIEFDVSRCSELDLTMAGQVRSWSWRPLASWYPARAAGDGLPGVAGFGFRFDGPAVARQLVRMARDRGLEVLERPDLEAWEPRLRYLLPQDFEDFQTFLEETLGCHVSLDRRGNVDRVVLPD